MRLKEIDESNMYIEAEQRADYQTGRANKYRDRSDEYQVWYEQEEQLAVEEEAEARAATSEQSSAKVTRKEADKIEIRDWPKMNDINVWKSSVVQAVYAASADDNLQKWSDWLKPALERMPDMNLLSSSGGKEFQAIDAKLSIALQKIINGAREAGRDVAMQLRLLTNSRGENTQFVMGREILAMIWKVSGLLQRMKLYSMLRTSTA